MGNQRTISRARSSSRREFLRHTPGVAATVATFHGFGRGLQVAGGDTIRVGLIGCGSRGTGAAMDALDADPGMRIVAVADLFADRLQASLAKIKAHGGERVTVDSDRSFVGFDGYRHVIEAADVVLIACASKFHPRYLRAAVEAGRHVFVEKPHGIDPVGVRV